MFYLQEHSKLAESLCLPAGCAGGVAKAMEGGPAGLHEVWPKFEGGLDGIQHRAAACLDGEVLKGQLEVGLVALLEQAPGLHMQYPG